MVYVVAGAGTVLFVIGGLMYLKASADQAKEQTTPDGGQ